jgi:predicted kinase
MGVYWIAMSTLFLTYGPTHSGKTTFGQQLKVKLGDAATFIHVDNDVVDEFIKENFNNLRTDKAVLARRTPSDPDLRLLIPQLVAGYALREGYHVIATAAHPKRVIRQSYYDIAKSRGARVVLLMFTLTDAQAKQRIEANQRHNGILDISPHGGATFGELFEKQKAILEEPTEAEKQACYKVFTVTPENVDRVLQEVVDLCTAA